MIRNITYHLLLIGLLVGLYGCNPDRINHLGSTEEIKTKMDTVKSKQIALRYSQGKNLFNQFCIACHPAPEKHVVDQYMFDNLFERMPAPAEDYFVNYISDSKKLKASGDKYAKKIDAIWGNSFQHQFKDSLTREDFSSLIIYIKIAANEQNPK